MAHKQRYGTATTKHYHSDRDLRIFSRAACRAYAAMRRSRVKTRVLLPEERFDRTEIFIPAVNDSTVVVAKCANRSLILRPTKSRGLMGIDPDAHGGEWLSSYLMWAFLSGEPAEE